MVKGISMKGNNEEVEWRKKKVKGMVMRKEFMKKD